MQFARQRREEIAINLTPLIDVVFLLLIFFMVSTSFIKETHLAIDLPKADNAQDAPVEADRLEVLIDYRGQYTINQRVLTATDSGALASALRNLSGEIYDTPLIITADAKAPHQAVVRVMDVAGKLGFSKLSFTTQPEEEQ